MMTRMILSDMFKNWFLLTTASVNLSEKGICRIICQAQEKHNAGSKI